jgi:nicotinate dehydrogenase subunit B
MTLPPSLQQNPNLRDWIQFEADAVIVRTGKVELGQGITTAIALIAADELDIPLARIRVRTGSTIAGPNEFVTAGSMSIESSGAAVRGACAEVRHYLLQQAAHRFGVATTDLVVDAGVISHAGSNDALSFAELMETAPDVIPATGNAPWKPVARYRLVGRTTTRFDLLAKLTGLPAFVMDLRPIDLVHGRIVRPPSANYRLVAIDTAAVTALPGVIRVVVDGSFIGVVATEEVIAVDAKNKLARLAAWQPTAAALPQNVHDYLLNHAEYDLLVVDGTPVVGAIPPIETGTHTVTAEFRKPYHMHASIGPSAALARFENGKLYVRSHSQGPSVIRDALAMALDMKPEDVAVEHAENAGCYGHNGADDAAMDAAMLARQVPGQSVLLKWHRQDEHAFEPYSPAMVMRLTGSVSDHRITHWNADVYSQTHSGRPFAQAGASNLIAAWHRSQPMTRPVPRPGMGNHSGIHRNADPYYTIPRRRIVKHLITDQRVRTSSTRGLGAFGNIFAIESFMDELAMAAGVDPVDFRLAHLTEPRAIAVIETARRLSRSYVPEVDAGWRTGSGLAFSRYKNRQTYAAVALHVAVHEETFAIRLLHGVIAADAGQIIDRDGLANQLEGGFIQSASWTLKEAVRFNDHATASTDWETYPILTFPEIPTVEVALLDHPELPSLGAGEATQGPTPAAIAGAIHDATGIRLREIPFTPDRLRSAALDDSP